MKIQASKFNTMINEHSFAIRSLRSITDNMDHLPQELKDEAEALCKKFEAYDIYQHRPPGQVLTGDILTLEQIRALVIDATGYTKWTIEAENDDDLASNLDDLESRFQVTIEYDQAVCYNVSRKVASRNDIHLMRIICLPGHTFVYLDTGRAGYDLEEIIGNDLLFKEIEEQFNGS